jgi:hypothetical protein
MKLFRSSRRTAPPAPLSPAPAPAQEDLALGVVLNVEERPWDMRGGGCLRWRVANESTGRYLHSYAFGHTREEAMDKWEAAFREANTPKVPIRETLIVPLPQGMEPCP